MEHDLEIVLLDKAAQGQTQPLRHGTLECGQVRDGWWRSWATAELEVCWRRSVCGSMGQGRQHDSMGGPVD
jgi:hypothetical protein